jgi:hypothetical protein
VTSNLGKASGNTRRQMSEAHKRRGTYPPAAGKLWQPWEEDLLGILPDVEVALRTGRKLSAVVCRRGPCLPLARGHNNGSAAVMLALRLA